LKLKLLEKKKFAFEELENKVAERGVLSIQDLLETKANPLYTLFINHTLVIKDVEDLTFIAYEDKNFIHGIVDVYDRVLREKMFNTPSHETGPKKIENDHIADIVIRSNLVLNVLELNVSNYIQHAPGESIALQNKFLIELYTDWHTQLHHKENEFVKYFFD